MRLVALSGQTHHFERNGGEALVRRGWQNDDKRAVCQRSGDHESGGAMGRQKSKLVVIAVLGGSNPLTTKGIVEKLDRFETLQGEEPRQTMKRTIPAYAWMPVGLSALTLDAERLTTGTWASD